MKTLELDLNKLEDNELEMYLVLKKRADAQQLYAREVLALGQPIVDEVATPAEPVAEVEHRHYKKHKKLDSGWVGRVKGLEDFLKKKERSRTEILFELKVPPQGGNYKTLIKYMTKIYGKRIIQYVKGKQVFYQLDAKGPTKRKYHKLKEGIVVDGIKLHLSPNDTAVFLQTDKRMEETGETFGNAFKHVVAPGRTAVGGADYKKWAIYLALKKRGLSKEQFETLAKPKAKTISVEQLVSITQTTPVDEGVEYEKFKEENVAKLMEKNNITKGEAVRMLAIIWRKAGRDYTKASGVLNESSADILPTKTFPQLSCLAPEMEPILLNMIERLIEDGNLELSYAMEGTALNIADYQSWKQFCESFILNAIQISEYMAVDNKFALVSNGKKGGLVLKYN
jgi:hypothetical protein